MKNIQKAVEDLQRWLARREYHTGGRLHHHERLIKAVIPIVESGLASTRKLGEADDSFDRFDSPTDETPRLMAEHFDLCLALQDAIISADEKLGEVFK